MKAVKIGELKNKLSAYLKRVRQGEEVVVTDRETPVARLVPFEKRPPRPLISEPAESIERLKKISFPPSPKKVDPLAALEEERKE